MGYGKFFESIKSRKNFVKIAKSGAKIVSPAFIVQGIPCLDVVNDKVFSGRFGITVTKRVGGSVVRSKVKRRIRAIIVSNLDLCCSFPAWEYVIIARAGSSVNLPFSALNHHFRRSLKNLHR